MTTKAFVGTNQKDEPDNFRVTRHPRTGAADTTCFVPFTDSVISFAMTLPPEQPDFTALRAASDPTCRHT
jgi:hypothetical protein